MREGVGVLAIQRLKNIILYTVKRYQQMYLKCTRHSRNTFLHKHSELLHSDNKEHYTLKHKTQESTREAPATTLNRSHKYPPTPPPAALPRYKYTTFPNTPVEMLQWVK